MSNPESQIAAPEKQHPAPVDHHHLLSAIDQNGNLTNLKTAAGQEKGASHLPHLEVADAAHKQSAHEDKPRGITAISDKGHVSTTLYAKEVEAKAVYDKAHESKAPNQHPGNGQRTENSPVSHHKMSMIEQIESATHQILQGGKREAQKHPQTWQHPIAMSAEAAVMGATVVTAGAAATVLAAPEIALVVGGAVALKAGVDIYEGMHDARNSYTKGKDANGLKHLGAVAADSISFEFQDTNVWGKNPAVASKR